jgi:hypothetical protein
LVVKTSLKEQPELACQIRADRDHRSLDPSKHLRRRKGSGGSLKVVGIPNYSAATGVSSRYECGSSTACKSTPPRPESMPRQPLKHLRKISCAPSPVVPDRRTIRSAQLATKPPSIHASPRHQLVSLRG